MKSVLLVTLLCLTLSACSEEVTPQPVVVQVFQDPAAREIGSAVLALGARQLKTPDGRPIIIATWVTKSYAEGLEILGHQTHPHPDLVIFNSSEDGKKVNVDVPPQSAVDISTKRFYLVIPVWVPQEQRQTAELVLVEMRAELQKTAQPTTGSPR